MRKLNPAFAVMLQGYKSPMLDNLISTLESTAPSVSVRVNRRKGGGLTFSDDKVAWESRGYYLDQRPKFTLDPAMHQGRYYVQDASSMIIGEAIRRIVGDSSAPLRYLDACAAPGGKTTAAIDALPEGSLVVANEYDPRRAQILAENVAKWGYPGVVVSKGDTSRLGKLSDEFDIVAVDAPCSGEGMMRKDATAVEQWSPGLVEQCAERQREILGNVWAALAPGGYLIYSTCTFNRRENEEVARWLLDEFGTETVDLGLPESWGICPGIDTDIPCCRFIPGRVRGEGLFLVVVRKPGMRGEGPSRKIKASNPARSAANISSCAHWVHGDFTLSVDGDMVHAVPTQWARTIDHCRKALNIVDYGVGIATIKGKDFIPTQQLAMSTALNPQAFPTLEVDASTALSYLRREAITLADAPRGYVLLCHNGFPLGFVKNLGNRANNLYPQHWRILTGL